MRGSERLRMLRPQVTSSFASGTCKTDANKSASMILFFAVHADIKTEEKTAFLVET